MDTAATAPSWASRTRRVLKAMVRKGTYGACGYKGYPIRYSRMRAAGRLRAAARARTAARGTPALTYCSHLTVAARMHRPNPNRPERLMLRAAGVPQAALAEARALCGATLSFGRFASILMEISHIAIPR